MNNPKKPAELSAQDKAEQWIDEAFPDHGRIDFVLHEMRDAFEAGFNSRTSEVEELVEALEKVNKWMLTISPTIARQSDWETNADLIHLANTLLTKYRASGEK